MIIQTKYICSGIKGVLKHEGVKSLISRGFTFLVNRCFTCEDYYIVTMDYSNADKEKEADYLPKAKNYCWKIISTNREADELIDKGFTLGAYELNLRASLDKNAVAICTFVDNELAHISCLADNPQGKKTVDPRPFDVDFKNKEAVVGLALTVPKFRRLRLRIYSGYILRRYCWEKGIRGGRFSIRANNYPTLAIAAQPPYKEAVSLCRLIRIFWFEYLKEKKMEPTPMKQIYEQTLKK